MSSETTFVTEIHGDLRLVPLADLPEGMAGAALVDARGTEVERITAPARRFDADAAFRRLDTRRSVLAGYVQRVQDDGNAEAWSRGASWLGARWLAREAAWHTLPWLVGAAHMWWLWRLGSEDTLAALVIMEFLLGAVLIAFAFQGRAGSGDRLLLAMVTASVAGFFMMYGLELAGVLADHPAAGSIAGYLVVSLFAVTCAQALLVMWLRSRWAPPPTLRVLDLSNEPAVSSGVALLCIQTHNGRAVPTVAVRYDTAAGTPACYILLPVRYVDRAPRTAPAAVAQAAVQYAREEQRNASLVAASRERLAALEDSMRQLDG